MIRITSGLAIFQEGGIIGTFCPYDIEPYSVVASKSEVEVSQQNFPNPFNNTTTIRFELSRPSFIDLDIFDIRGRQVRVLVHGEKPAGIHFAVFNACELSSGLYFYRIKTGSYMDVKKMICVR